MPAVFSLVSACFCCYFIAPWFIALWKVCKYLERTRKHEVVLWKFVRVCPVSDRASVRVKCFRSAVVSSLVSITAAFKCVDPSTVERYVVRWQWTLTAGSCDVKWVTTRRRRKSTTLQTWGSSLALVEGFFRSFFASVRTCLKRLHDNRCTYFTIKRRLFLNTVYTLRTAHVSNTAIILKEAAN